MLRRERAVGGAGTSEHLPSPTATGSLDGHVRAMPMSTGPLGMSARCPTAFVATAMLRCLVRHGQWWPP